MAVLCRCEDHPPRNNRKYVYTHTTEPIGFPNTSSICGNRKCNNIGLIYMDKAAVAQYAAGRRIFNYATWVTKVRVKNIQPRKIKPNKT